MSVVTEFMGRVVPWPEGKGYVNLHWRTPNPQNPKKDFWHGKPCENIQDFLGILGWVQRQPSSRDIYFCLSLQSKSTLNKSGRLMAVRSTPNALALKAIWLDIDLKKPPKGYRTFEEAFQAIEDFCDKYSLPPPSAIVNSGGGLHVYWFSKETLTPTEWYAYANGLKAAALEFGLRCDAGCTIDSARVLRVPDTANFKTDPARPVKLLGLRPPEEDYTFAESLVKLVSLAPAPKSEKDLSHLPMLGEKVESLSEGLSKAELLDPAPIMAGCGFLRTALETGGKDYDYPLWHLTTLAATFMEDGNALAHKMGGGHSGYSRESTESLYQQKVQDRLNRGIGWPHCNTIQAAGCKSCAVCPRLALDKTPLHLAIEAKQTSGVSQEETLHLPEDYFLKDGYIIFNRPTKGGDPEPCQLFLCRIVAPEVIMSGEQQYLTFITSFGKGRTRNVSIPLKDMFSGTDIQRLLTEQGVIYNPKYKSNLESFIMSWLAKLRDAKKAENSFPFGWIYKESEGEEIAGKPIGFAYAGTNFMDDGSEKPGAHADPSIRGDYTPHGSRVPWVEAAKMVTDQKRPELDTIICASFAAPLISFAGQYAALLSVWGKGGEGKSTATRVAMAVWGHPIRSREAVKATARHTLQKMGLVRNLPIVWDEVRNYKQVGDTVHDTSGGVTPGRLNSNSSIQQKYHWATMLIICSNGSIADHLATKDKNTNSGVLRVFEYKVYKKTDGPGRYPTTVIPDELLARLDFNYGRIGVEYAQYLGNNASAVKERVQKVTDEISLEIKVEQEERYWAAIVAAILVGGEHANMCGAEIDLVALRRFLIKTYYLNRSQMAEENFSGGTHEAIENILTAFTKDHSDQSMWTDYFYKTEKLGRPNRQALKIFHHPDTRFNRPINIQWAVYDGKVRISYSKISEYLTKKEIAVRPFIDGLKEYFGATSGIRYTLGAGTIFGRGQETVVELIVQSDSPLYPTLMAYHDETPVIGASETPQPA